MSAEMTVDLITLAVAAAGPFLAYLFARRLFVSGNRHTWINALRDDLSELISVSDLSTIMFQDFEKQAGMIEPYRDVMVRLQALRYRIRLRLTKGKPRHDRLMQAVEAYVQGQKAAASEREVLRASVVDAAEDLLEHVWKNVERGR